MFVMYRVGPELSLQTDAVVWAIDRAVLSLPRR